MPVIPISNNSYNICIQQPKVGAKCWCRTSLLGAQDSDGVSWDGEDSKIGFQPTPPAQMLASLQGICVEFLDSEADKWEL